MSQSADGDTEPNMSKADQSDADLIAAVRGDRLIQWSLLDGNRLRVAVALLAAMTVVIAASLYLLRPDLGGDRMRWLFNGLVNGLLSLVTIILTINQLILSRQFGSPNDLYDRLNKRIDFRKRVEDETGSVIAPSQPGGFMRVLFRALRGRATEFAREVDLSDGRLQNEVDDYVDTITGQTNRVADDLEENPFEMDGILTILNYDDSWQFYTTRRFQTIYGDRFSDHATDLLEEMRELLKQIDTARQYFKTLYLQRELAQLSRHVVYVGVVAILVASVSLLAFQASWRPDLGYTWTVALLSVLTGLTIAPVAVLFSYALRLATITRRTVVFGPFTPEEEQRLDSDWNT